MKFHPAGLPTGIGSMPYTGPEAAVSLVIKYLPSIPHWPQLPRRTHLEFYLWQFLQLLQDLELLKVTGDTHAYFTSDEPEWPQRQARFYDYYLAAAGGDPDALQQFAFPMEAAAGYYHFMDELADHGTGEAQWLKGQVVGLLTIGFQITDPDNRPAYYDPGLRDILLKQLSLQAAWQVQQYSKFGLPSLIFMDDPVIDSCGRYDRIGVDRQQVMNELSEFAAFVRQWGGLAGVHSCADLDWSLLLDADIDIVSFDAYQFGQSFALFPDLINTFMKRGGVVAWGLVPTMGDSLAGEDAESLVTRNKSLFKFLKDKGVNPALLRTQSLITPACGTGTLNIPEAERIYQLTATLSERWEDMMAAQ
jgi:hypothetical protein